MSNSSPADVINGPVTKSHPGTIRAPRGQEHQSKAWPQEAALRMFMNSLDKTVALYSRSDRDNSIWSPNWESYKATLTMLKELGDTETLLVQSGEPAGVLQTHPWAPRVLQVEPIRAPKSDLQGLTHRDNLPCQAGNWFDLGMLSPLQTAYETFTAAAKRHFSGEMRGKWVVSSGMGPRGGTLALAATLQGAVFLGIEPDSGRIKQRVRAGTCDYCVSQLEEALRILKNGIRKRQPISVGLIGNGAEVIPEMARRGILPDLLTDRTNVNDLMHNYLPCGLTVQQAEELRTRDPSEALKQAHESIARHVQGMLELQKLGAVVFEFGNNLRKIAFEQAGAKAAYGFPDYISAYLRPLQREGNRPVGWMALSGDPADLYRIYRLILELFPQNEPLCRWIHGVQQRVKFHGLPACLGWLGYDERILLGERINVLVAQNELKAPVVIGRDFLDLKPDLVFSGTEAEPADLLEWETLNKVLHLASGAYWLSLKEGSGLEEETPAVQIAQAGLADGSMEMGRKLQCVLAEDLVLRIPSETEDASP